MKPSHYGRAENLEINGFDPELLGTILEAV
jgi:hypothetical protein